MRQTIIRFLLFVAFFCLDSFVIHWSNPVLWGFISTYIFEGAAYQFLGVKPIN